MDDTELVLRLARDLDGSFEALVQAHVDRCHAIALRLGNPHDAEEITQDALVRAYRALAGYDPDRIRELRLRPWLTTIVLNLCRNRARTPRVAVHAPRPARRGGREPAAERATDPATSPAAAPSASAWRRSSRPSPTATASPWCSATSTTCPTRSWPRSSAGPRAPSRPRSTGGSPCCGPRWPATELEELTA